MNDATEPNERAGREIAVLIVSIFIIASCGLLYELLISSISSYFLGSSITHFSITIGLFMFFMGVGSFLSKFVEHRLLERFIQVEIGVGLIGGLSAAILYFAFSVTQLYYLIATLLIATISIGIGFEIPLVTRLANRHQSVKDALANMLAFDYLGALVSSLLFPLVMLPYLGIMKTAFLVGMLNVGIAFVNIAEFRNQLHNPRRYQAAAAAAFAILFAGFVYSFSIVSFFERFVYEDEIVYSTQTPYQKLVLTKFKDDLRLFINGDLQFCSLDEYRYHEPLVQVPMGLSRRHQQVLVLGGGDGLVVRELLKFQEVNEITLVDLDGEMLEIAKHHALLTEINQGSLNNPKVRLVVQDAYKFLESSSEQFDVIIVDLPDPNDLTLGKLYSQEFYRLLKRRLSREGVMVTQSTSPYLARIPFWSINHTLKAVFPHVLPYHSYVPSFGLWGFNLASEMPLRPEEIGPLPQGRYLTPALLPSLFVFDNDTSDVPAEVNRLDNQILIQYYEQSWDRWN